MTKYQKLNWIGEYFMEIKKTATNTSFMLLLGLEFI